MCPQEIDETDLSEVGLLPPADPADPAAGAAASNGGGGAGAGGAEGGAGGAEELFVLEVLQWRVSGGHRRLGACKVLPTPPPPAAAGVPPEPNQPTLGRQQQDPCVKTTLAPAWSRPSEWAAPLCLGKTAPPVE